MKEIPVKILNNGVAIPIIGNGPGIPGYSAKYVQKNNLFKRAYKKFIGRPLIYRQWIDAVAHSFRIGYSLVDNSAAYGNEMLLYKAICKSSVPREQLFLTTRVSNKAQYNHRVREELFATLKSLHTDYVDLYQFHWPVTGCFLDTWQEMVKLYKEGYCRCLGVANCHVHHLETILANSEIVPTVNQIEIHPLFTQKDLITYCFSKGIAVEAYTPIARFDDRLMRLPSLSRIANKYQKTIPQVILRWHIQNGVIPVIRSLNKKRQLENISVFDFNLTPHEMAVIDGLNINSRLRYDPDNCDFTIL